MESMMTKSQRGTMMGVAVVIWTYAVTICRALRRPNDFSEAHWLLDYRFGFIKRGLIGSICSLATDTLGINMTPGLIGILSAIALCSMSIAMLYVILQAPRRPQAGTNVFVLAAVFASSPFIVMSAHLLGYFDAILYVLAIASVMLILRGHPCFAALVSSLAILTHESYLLIGLPLVCLAAVAVRAANTGHSWRWTPHILAICIPVAVFLAASLLQGFTTDAATLRAQLAERLDSFGFVASRSKGVAEWQTTSVLTFFHQQHSDFDERLLNPVMLASVTPTLLTILACIHSSYGIRAFSPFSLMLLGVVCAPLALHAVAWDLARISTYPIGGGLIAWWILAQTRRAQPTDDLILLLALPALVLNVFGHIPLMDCEVERFSDPLRVVLYLPAIAFVTTIVGQHLNGNWFAEFMQERISRKGIDCDEE